MSRLPRSLFYSLLSRLVLVQVPQSRYFNEENNILHKGDMPSELSDSHIFPTNIVEV